MKVFWDIQRQINCFLSGKKLKLPPSPNIISYPLLCGKLLALSYFWGVGTAATSKGGKNRDCLIKSAMLVLTMWSALWKRHVLKMFLSHLQPAVILVCCNTDYFDVFISIKWADYSGLCAIQVTYIATALLAVKVWIKVWKAGSLDFATTLKHNAIQGVERGPCSPSILENYFWQRAAVCIIQQLVWGKKYMVTCFG